MSATSMLIRLIDRIADSILVRLPIAANLVPLASTAASNSHAGLTVRQIFDGLDFATPKRRTPLKVKWRQKYGNDNWKDGTKLFKPKRNIVTCMECGGFHELHTICRACFKKIQDESANIMKDIRNAWGNTIIDKEVQILYQGEGATSIESKRVVELERPRPLWFEANLGQRAANPSKQIAGPVTEIENLDVKPRIVDGKET